MKPRASQIAFALLGLVTACGSGKPAEQGQGDAAEKPISTDAGAFDADAAATPDVSSPDDTHADDGGRHDGSDVHASDARDTSASDSRDASIEHDTGVPDASEDLAAADAALDPSSGSSDASDADASDADGGGSFQTACQMLADASCARLAQCEPSVFIITYGNEAQCRALFAANCPDALSRSGSAPASDVMACAASLPAMSCNRMYDARWGGSDSYTPLDYDEVLEACGVHGAKADGEACVSSAQCASAHCTFRQGYGQTTCGVCRTPGTQGASCLQRSSSRDDCAQGYYCKNLGSGNGHECWRNAPVGGLCSPIDMSAPASSVGCAMDAHCPMMSGPLPVTANCIPKQTLGQPCDLISNAEPRLFCGGTLRCSPTTRTCYEAESELRQEWDRPILGQGCDNGPTPPYVHCRFPASCTNRVCSVAPLPSCPI